MEILVLFVTMLLTGIWMVTQRANAGQLRCFALLFVGGVAFYAIMAKLFQAPLQAHVGLGSGHFGFFPNRNHTATFLSMGALCGMGCILQSIRDKKFWSVGFSLVATAICLWSIAGWSISRGGVVLVAIGSVIWLVLLGRQYLGRHGLWAIGLISLTAAGMFLISDNTVKQRISQTVEKSTAAAGIAEPVAANGPPATQTALGIDLRIPIAIDTFQLIKDFKWTGVGAGQFYFVFPQYRNLSAVVNQADCYHPESDFQWLAAETGVPATLALMGLIGAAFWYSRRGIMRGKDRALRSACLIAAMLVPIHGFFDVPGHRITIAWFAAFLFTLSLQPSEESAEGKKPFVWPFRLLAIGILAVGGYLVSAQWMKGPQPAFTSAKTAIENAERLFAEDQALQALAAEQGIAYDPKPDDDLLEKALAGLASAAKEAPLDRNLARHVAKLAFYFDDKYDLATGSLALDSALDPTWVDGPLREAEAWSTIDIQRTLQLWRVAMELADDLDRIQGGTRFRDQTLLKIKRMGKDKPSLAGVLSDFLKLPQ